MYSPIDLMPVSFTQLAWISNAKILEPHGRILGSESIAQALKVKCVTLTAFPKESEQFSANQKQDLNFPNFCMCPYEQLAKWFKTIGLQTTSERRLQTLETYLLSLLVHRLPIKCPPVLRQRPCRGRCKSLSFQLFKRLVFTENSSGFW